MHEGVALAPGGTWNTAIYSLVHRTAHQSLAYNIMPKGRPGDSDPYIEHIF